MYGSSVEKRLSTKKHSSNEGIYFNQLHLILFNFLWSSKYKSLFYIFIDMCFEALLIDRQTPSLTKSKIAIKKFAFPIIAVLII